jgi:hypothetical protein
VPDRADTPRMSDATLVLRKLAVRVFALALVSAVTGQMTLTIALTLAGFGLLFARVS